MSAQWGQMPRKFTSEKTLRYHTDPTGETYLMEGTPTFAARQRVLSPGQNESVDVRTGPGVRRDCRVARRNFTSARSQNRT